MKLIWHIILKDIRRERVALLLWMVLFFAQVIIGAVLLQQLGEGYIKVDHFIDKLQIGSGVLAVAQFVMGYVLVARLVQADLLVGAEMFWSTRPISRGRLLAAKATGAILLFGLLPIVLLSPWWLWCGFTARDIFWTGVDTFGWQLLMIAPAFLIASLTNELGRVLLWTIVLFVAALLWIALLGNFLTAAQPDVDPFTGTRNGTLYTGIWLANVLFIIFSLAVAGHQYLTRNVPRSIGLMVAGTGLAVAVGILNPLDWSTAMTDLPRPAFKPETLAALAATKAVAGVSMRNDSLRLNRDGEASLLTEVYFQGLPEDTSSDWGFARQSWRWSDGLTVNRGSNIGAGGFSSYAWLRRQYKLPEPARDPETDAWVQAKRDEFNAKTRLAAAITSRKLLPPSREGRRSFVYANVPEAMLKRAQTEPPTYEATLRCVAMAPFLQAELPIQGGASDRRNSARVQLTWLGDDLVEHDVERGQFFSMLMTVPSLRNNGLWLVNTIVPFLGTNQNGEMLLVNRDTGWISSQGYYSLQSNRRVYVAGVVLSWNQGRLRPQTMVRNKIWVISDPQWREHSSLVLVGKEVAGRFTTSVKTDRMEFRNSKYLAEGETPPVIAHD